MTDSRITEAYEAALDERNTHDEFSNIWRFYDGICEGLDRARRILEGDPACPTSPPRS